VSQRSEVKRKILAHGFVENKNAAIEGGNVAGVARRELEKRSSQPVSSPENYLDVPEKEKRKRLKDD
jgi:DNA-damage-inducible protein D